MSWKVVWEDLEEKVEPVISDEMPWHKNVLIHSVQEHSTCHEWCNWKNIISKKSVYMCETFIGIR